MTGTAENVANTPRVFFERVNYVTGERAGRVEITGKSEREVERLERGLLRNLHPDWMLDTVAEPAPPSSLRASHEGMAAAASAANARHRDEPEGGR